MQIILFAKLLKKFELKNVFNLYSLTKTGIEPPDIRNKGNTNKLYKKALKNQTHLFHTVSSYYQTTQKTSITRILDNKVKQIKIQSAKRNFWAHNK